MNGFDCSSTLDEKSTGVDDFESNTFEIETAVYTDFNQSKSKYHSCKIGRA